MRLSVVSTLFSSSQHVEEFHRRVSEEARKFAGEDYEIILVDDGSPDDSLAKAVDLLAHDPHLKVIELSRNFGHHKAIMTGLAHAQGDRVFLIDSDLEEQPEWLDSFAKQMRDQKSDVVYGIQEKRRGSVLDRLLGSIYYKIVRALTGIKQPDNIVTARLMTRQYVRALVRHKERELTISSIWIITGFKQSHRYVKKESTSETSYTFAAKLSHVINAISSFSNKPLIFTFFSGVFVLATAIIYGCFLIFNYLFANTPPSGYTSLIASVWLLSGLIIFFQGILGIYLAKVFSEVKRRPYTIIKHIHQQEKILKSHHQE